MTDPHRDRAPGPLEPGELVWVSLLFVVVTAVLASPLSLHPGSSVFGLNPDTRLYVWTLGWDVHALLTHPWSIFDSNIFYPEPRTLAYSENLIGSAILAAPVLLASANPVLAMNAVALGACVLCGLGTYVLARRLGVRVTGSIVAGMIFAFAPPRFCRLGQTHLAPVQWIPFALASFHTYAYDRRRRNLLAAVALFTLQTVTSGHAGLFLALTLAGLALFLFACGRLPPFTRVARDFGLIGVLLVVPSVLCLRPYLEVARDVGLHRTIGRAYEWSPNAASFLAAPTHVQQAIISRVPGLARRVAKAQSDLFPGWLTLVLAMLAVVWRGPFTGGAMAGSPTRCRGVLRGLVRQVKARTGVEGAFYVLLALVSLWACLGPAFGLYALLYRVVPGFDLIRVPARFMVLTLLALAILAGIGLDRLTGVLTGRARRALGAAVVALLIGEFSAFPLKTDPYTVEADLPQIARVLAARPKPFVALELPVADPLKAARLAALNSRYMIHSMLHWQPLVNGYSGYISPHRVQLLRALVTFPDASTLTQLEEMGVTYVVLNRDLYSEGAWEPAVAAIARFPDRLHLEAETSDGQLYSLPHNQRSFAGAG